MVESDFGPFAVAFRRLAGASQLRVKPVEFPDLIRSYFEALEDAPLDAVLAAATTCRNTLTRFPKIPEWKGAIVTRRSPAADLRWMSATEVDVHARAAARGYQGDPCPCAGCLEAGVSDRGPRFVPNDLGDGLGDEQAWNPHRAQVETIGRWIHGAELARWYALRDAFFARADRKLPGVSRLLRHATGPWIGENYAAEAAAHAEARRTGRTLRLVRTSREPGEEG